MKRTLTDIASLSYQVYEPKQEIKLMSDLIDIRYKRNGKFLSRTIRRDTAIEARILLTEKII